MKKKNMKGDISILRGNGFQALRHIYWSNNRENVIT